MLSMTGNVVERLLIICVVSLITVCCIYWASRPESDFRLAERLRPVKDCGFDTFRSVAGQRSNGYIPGSGTWTRNGTSFEHFQPSICHLSHGKWIPEDELATCLRRDRVRYIAIIGDSNGRYYLRTMHRLLSRAADRSHQRQRRIVCGPVVRHNELPYARYQSPQMLVKHRCLCGGYCTVQFTLRNQMRFVHCYVLQARCTVDNVTDVVMEYITSWFTIDPKVQVRAITVISLPEIV